MKCANNLTCIKSQLVCDGERLTWNGGCKDDSDEDPELCKNWICPELFWMCHDRSRCVQENEIFDGFPDCFDGSDEDIKYHTHWNCSEGYHKCDSGDECIEVEYVCDGIGTGGYRMQYCKDGSDELKCEDWECFPGHWKCKNNISEDFHIKGCH